MNRTIKIIDFFFRPFYSYLFFFPLNIKFIRFPVYQQFQFLHFRFFRRYYDFSIIRSLLGTGELKLNICCNPGADSVQMHIYQTGSYEKDLSEFCKVIFSKVDVFIDAGSHIGYYSLLASHYIRSQSMIYCYEPCERTFFQLKENLTINNVGNARCFNYALGYEEKEEFLFINKNSSNSSFFSEQEGSIGKQKTEVKRFDDIQVIDGERIFVKIDTEGYEFEVLQGMIQTLTRNNCWVLFEHSSALLKKNNYYDANRSKIESLFHKLNECHYSYYHFVGDTLCQIPNIISFFNDCSTRQCHIVMSNT